MKNAMKCRLKMSGCKRKKNRILLVGNNVGGHWWSLYDVDVICRLYIIMIVISFETIKLMQCK